MQEVDEQNRADLSGTEAVEKLKELAEKAGNCFFTTKPSHFPHTSRPMALQEVDEEGNLWFISSKQSHKNAEIEGDNQVTLYFQNNGSYEFLVVSGKATIYTDRELIEKYWNNLANAWFDGKDDPNVTVIAVAPSDCDYWDTKDGKIISFIKMTFKALTNTTKGNDGGVEGKLAV